VGTYEKAVTGKLGTFAGVYAPAAPGRIRWEKTPEFPTPKGERVMGFCDCNGVFYCATSRHIYQRTDGTAPVWKEIYFCPEEINPCGIRGLSAVPSQQRLHACHLHRFQSDREVGRDDPKSATTGSERLAKSDFLIAD